MSRKNLCRLCVNICPDHKNLYDEKGYVNEVYELMTKYFDETVLNTKYGNHLTVICMECWSRITDFHNFHLLVHQAQNEILIKYRKIDINYDEEFLTESISGDQISYIKSEVEDLNGSTSSSYLHCGIATRVQETVVENEIKPDIVGIEANNSKTEETTSISLPKLELMDVYSKEEISQGELVDNITKNDSLTTDENLDDKISTPREITDKEMDALTAQWKSAFECHICSETSSTFNLLKLHFSQKHSETQFYIECCQRKLKYRSEIADHIRYHINPNAFKCQLCNTRHTTKWFFQSHMRNHHSKPNEALTKIPKRNIVTEKEYIDLISQWKPVLECIVCRQTYSSLPQLKLHFGQSHPHTELYIECCNRKLKKRYHILQHIRLHADPNAFKCEFCSKCFKCRRDLFRHKTTQHQMEKILKKISETEDITCL